MLHWSWAKVAGVGTAEYLTIAVDFKDLFGDTFVDISDDFI